LLSCHHLNRSICLIRYVHRCTHKYIVAYLLIYAAILLTSFGPPRSLPPRPPIALPRPIQPLFSKDSSPIQPAFKRSSRRFRLLATECSFSSQNSKNKCFFHRAASSQFHGCRRLMDQCGTLAQKLPSGLLTMISRRAYRD
jgi:hypothetical protein